MIVCSTPILSILTEGHLLDSNSTISFIQQAVSFFNIDRLHILLNWGVCTFSKDNVPHMHLSILCNSGCIRSYFMVCSVSEKIANIFKKDVCIVSEYFKTSGVFALLSHNGHTGISRHPSSIFAKLPPQRALHKCKLSESVTLCANSEMLAQHPQNVTNREGEHISVC